MKRLILAICIAFFFAPLLNAQTNTFPNSGSVGIGTLSPARDLDVQGSISVSGDIYGDATAGNLGIFSGTAYTNGAYLKAYGQDWGGGLSLVAGQNGTTGTNGKIRFIHWNGASWLDRMVIDETGDVGIGTSSPQARLHLNGRMLVQAPAGSGFAMQVDGGSNSGLLVNTQHTAGYAFGVKVTADHPYTKGISIGENGQDPGFFVYANGMGHLKEALAVGTTLNTDPVDGKFYRVSVDGRIRASEVKVYTGWADFVFEDDYQLRPLEEVESFIAENGHLPDVPSASEVAENGVNLGESDAILLQKIEELTLYIIQLDEKIKDLENENASLISQPK